MREDAGEEDYLDDPIRLFECEQSRVCYTELADIIIEDPGFVIDTTKEERFEKILSEFRNKTSLLPITFFENDRNVELLSECCPLTVNVVDCGKFVTYREKRKEVDISSNVTDVSQNLTYKYTNMLPKRTKNTTEVVNNQVFDQINLRKRETTSIANINNSAMINQNKDHKIKNNSVDANVLNRPKLGTPTKSQNDELNVNRDHKQRMNNLKQTSNSRECAVEKEINDILEKQLADIVSGKINKPGKKVIEHFENKMISRTDEMKTTMNLNIPNKIPTNVTKNYDEQIMKFKMSHVNRNESLKTRVMSNHVQQIESIQASHSPPKVSQTTALKPDAAITTQCIQNKPCTRVMCDKRLFSANKEIPHYHNTSLTNTVTSRQQDHNSNKTDYAAYTSNSLNDINNISNRNMNNNNIPSNLTPNTFISPYGSNYVTSQRHKHNTNSPNMRITKDGYENPPGLRDISKGLSFIQTNNDKIPPFLIQNHLINANKPQNFSIGSVLPNNFPQTYILPPPPAPVPPPPVPPPPLAPLIDFNFYNANLHPPIYNIVREAENLPLVVQDPRLAHANINSPIVRPNLPPQTQVSQAQSSFMNNKEGMINISPSIIQKNDTRCINNLIYLPGTSTSTDQLNQSINTRGYENKNMDIPNKHPHLALEGQPMEKNPEQNNATKHPHLVKVLQGQLIEKKPKDNNSTKVINSNDINTLNNKSKTVRSNSVTDKKNKTKEVNKINENEPTKSIKGNNTISKPRTSISDYKMVNNSTKGDQQSDYINKPAERTANVGYSPPILPIPSYQEVLESFSALENKHIKGDTERKLNVNTEKTNDATDDDTPLQNLPKPILKKACKRKIEDANETLSRKISLSDYKDRYQRTVNNKE